MDIELWYYAISHENYFPSSPTRPFMEMFLVRTITGKFGSFG